jgi:thiamine biosynthesis lipoprotein ApbE
VTVSTREKLTENFGAMNPTVGNLENPWKNPAEKQKPKPSGLGPTI